MSVFRREAPYLVSGRTKPADPYSRTTSVLQRGSRANGLEATSFGDCGLFGLFPGNRSHGILGVLQHYRHLADLGLLGPRD